MRIEPVKAVSAPIAEGQEIAPASNRRAPRDFLSRHGASVPLPPLQIGQELEALIVEEFDNGRLLLRIGATLIEAESPGGLGAGQSVRLRVEQLQPQVVLHIMDLEPTLGAEAARLLRSHLPARIDSGELLASLQYRLKTLLDTSINSGQVAGNLDRLQEMVAAMLMSGSPPSAEKLKLLARNGGLIYESKLFEAAASEDELLDEIGNRDLKGLLLAALETSAGSGLPKGLQTALGAQLDNVETQQAVNLLAQTEGGALQLQIPFFSGAGFATALLAMEPDEHGPDESASGKNGYSVLFMLDLENFGRTRIDAHIRGKELRAIFFVDNERSLQLIRQELFGLRETLLALGYRNIHLAAKPLRDLPLEKQEKFAALAAGTPLSFRLLDVKA